MDQKGKVAIITGASRGMGKQMALRLAKRGVNVVLAARTVSANESEWPGSLTETANEIRALGVDAIPVKCDLTIRKDVENLCHTALDKYGRVDYLLNNARYVGEGHFDTFLNISFDLWDKYLAANVMAPIIASEDLPAGDGQAKERRHHQHHLRGGVFGLRSARRPRRHGTPLPVDQGGARPFHHRGLAGDRRDGHPGDRPRSRRDADRAGQIQTAKFGFDMSIFHSMDIPAAAAEYLCTCPYPMRYNGQMVVASVLVKQFNLLK